MTVYTPGGPCLTKTQHDEQVFQRQWMKGTLNSAGKAQSSAGGSASASQSTTNTDTSAAGADASANNSNGASGQGRLLSVLA